MKIYFAADHGGYRLKERLKKIAAKLGHEVIDAGAFGLDPADDYPDFIVPAVKAAVADKALAVVLGGSGNGECIAANKIKGARATLCFDAYTAKAARLDNNANVLCLGGRTAAAKAGLAEKILKTWLGTAFSGAARHQRRLNKIAKLERA